MKTKKLQKKKKVKNIFFKIILGIVVLAIISFGVYYFLTAEDEESSLTLLEKQWIEKNKTTLIDIKLPNNIYIFANSGEGILFDFLNEFEENTELTFNKIAYEYNPQTEDDTLGFFVLKNSDKIKDNDIIVFEDNYVLLSNKDMYISNLSEINDLSVGILTSDSSNISFDQKINIKKYDSITTLLAAIKKGDVAYVCIPRYAYLKNILQEKLYINYNLSNISNKVVLRPGKDEKLNTILSKNLENWLEKDYREEFEKKLMDFYVSTTNVSDLEKSSLVSRVYKYGYVEDISYNVINSSELYGVAGEYINTLKNMIGIEFQFVEYETKKDLEKALNNGSIDLAFVNFEYQNNNYLNTSSPFDEKLVAISNKYLGITNKSGLTNNKLYIYEDNYLYDYFKDNHNVKLIDDYKAEIPNDGIMILDEVHYLYLKDELLNSYQYLFTDTFTGEYKFIVNSKNEVLYNLINFVLNNIDYNEYKATGINNLLEKSNNQNSFNEIYFILLAIILLPIIVILLSIVIINNSKKLRITKKENFLRYNDMLTNLKNRNYLNKNIEKWDDTKIYPRTIIIIDLNNLKYVNDNYGHEAGNELIKKAAAVLINTQLEKSEIVRTDGNEFLIYLIGYSKTQISTYISKLSKEFDKLPYGFGAAIGYSVIEDEIKTIDDAINEATIEMRIDKHQNYK